MATVLSLYQPHSFFEKLKAMTLVAVTPGEHLTLAFQNGQQKLVLDGNFLAQQGGGLTGTVERVTLYNGDAKVFEIYGAEDDLAAYLQSLPKGTFDADILPRLLGGNNHIYGSDGDDGLLGLDGNDTIHAGPGNDRIDAGAGDDLISGGTGNNTIDGGAGFDRVVESGNLADYRIARSGNAITVTSLKDGSVDTLVNVERILFDDKQLALDVNADDHGGQVFRLYRAAFDRAPDEGGLRFWNQQLDKGMSLLAITQALIGSDEYKKLYGGAPSNHDLVVKYYEHILHREPDQGGLEFWTGVLDQHRASVAEVLATISESAENVAATAPLIGIGLVLDYPIIH